MKLKGQSALITGATQGLGFEIEQQQNEKSDFNYPEYIYVATDDSTTVIAEISSAMQKSKYEWIQKAKLIWLSWKHRPDRAGTKIFIF